MARRTPPHALSVRAIVVDRRRSKYSYDLSDYQIEAAANLAEIEARLQESAVKYHFGIIAVHDLKATMKAKGIDLNMDCRIYEVCNPQQAKKVLEANGAISTALPCRISVYGVQGQYRLATMLPTEMMKVFNEPSVEPVAKEVEDVIVQMMKDAAERAA